MNRKNFIASIGSVNADLTVKVPHFPVPGEMVAGNNFNLAIGGKGYNQATAAYLLSSLNSEGDEVDVWFFGATGTTGLSSAIDDFTGQNGPKVSFQTYEGPCGIALIEVDQSGQNRIVIDHGANFKFNYRDLEPALIDPEPDLILLQNEINADVNLEVLQFSKKNGIFTIFDPAPMDENVSIDILRMADLITPNENEFEKIVSRNTNIKLASDLDQQSDQYFLSILDALGLNRVALTLGPRGLRYFQRPGLQFPFENQFHKTPKFFSLPAIKVNEVDTTGAGDTFNGALAAAFLSGSHYKLINFKDKLAFAVAAASISTESFGAINQTLTADQVLLRMGLERL